MDETYYYSQESRLLVIVVSVLLHILLLIILFMFQAMGPLSDAEKSFLQPNLQQDATTILSQSPVQAANVIFQDLPAPADYEYDENAVPSSTPTTSASSRPESEIGLATSFEEPSEQETNEQEGIAHDDEGTTSLDSSVDYQGGIETTTPEPYERYESISSPSATHYYIQEKPAQKPRKKTQPKNKNPYARPISQEAAAKLGRITTGFMQSMQQEQGGVPRLQQDIYAMKQHMFNTKVWSILRQTINAQQEIVHLPNNLTTEAIVTITIGKKGNFIDFQLIHENKTPELIAIEKILRKAASNSGLYLPIPSHLNADTLTVRFKLNIQGERGFHTYHLSYQ